MKLKQPEMGHGADRHDIRTLRLQATDIVTKTILGARIWLFNIARSD
jgi:hypothetical protein